MPSAFVRPIRRRVGLIVRILNVINVLCSDDVVGVNSVFIWRELGDETDSLSLVCISPPSETDPLDEKQNHTAVKRLQESPNSSTSTAIRLKSNHTVLHSFNTLMCVMKDKELYLMEQRRMCYPRSIISSLHKSESSAVNGTNEESNRVGVVPPVLMETTEIPNNLVIVDTQDNMFEAVEPIKPLHKNTKAITVRIDLASSKAGSRVCSP